MCYRIGAKKGMGGKKTLSPKLDFWSILIEHV